MKTERLIVLVSPEEKARVERLAKRQRKSVAELVRNALSDFEAAQRPGARPNGKAPAEDAELSAEQKAALERLAETALSSMQRANAALDKAFEEVEATKAQLAEERAKKRAASA
ncbi:MAG: ribbon-helix-helix protein, CopG family [Kiloniellales bacterium]|nr:ribbon-helix-helix protein, CopG family [Kiloniellales bacterium]